MDQLEHTEVRRQEFVQEYCQLEAEKVIEEQLQLHCWRLQSSIQIGSDLKETFNWRQSKTQTFDVDNKILNWTSGGALRDHLEGKKHSEEYRKTATVLWNWTLGEFWGNVWCLVQVHWAMEAVLLWGHFCPIYRLQWMQIFNHISNFINDNFTQMNGIIFYLKVYIHSIAQ